MMATIIAPVHMSFLKKYPAGIPKHTNSTASKTPKRKFGMVLDILSNYNYAELDPYGITISLVCALNHSPVIQDLLISCFEKWDAIEAIDILQNLKLEESWLIEYRDEVVE